MKNYKIKFRTQDEFEITKEERRFIEKGIFEKEKWIELKRPDMLICLSSIAFIYPFETDGPLKFTQEWLRIRIEQTNKTINFFEDCPERDHAIDQNKKCKEKAIELYGKEFLDFLNKE